MKAGHGALLFCTRGGTGSSQERTLIFLVRGGNPLAWSELLSKVRSCPELQ